MLRFYGLRPSEVESLDIETFNALWLAINVLEAQEQLLSIQAAGFSTMKESARKKIEKDLRKQADGLEEENKQEVTMKDLGKILASASG